MKKITPKIVLVQDHGPVKIEILDIGNKEEFLWIMKIAYEYGDLMVTQNWRDKRDVLRDAETLIKSGYWKRQKE